MDQCFVRLITCKVYNQLTAQSVNGKMIGFVQSSVDPCLSNLFFELNNQNDLARVIAFDGSLIDQFVSIPKNKALSADFGASMINTLNAVSSRRIDNAFANDWTRLDTVLIHQFGLRITNRASDIATCRQIGNQLLKHGSTAD